MYYHQFYPDHGTGLTNFDPHDTATYLEAIRLYDEQASEADKDNFFIEMNSMPNSCPGFWSLHSLNGKDASVFWNIFDHVNTYMPTKTRQWLSKI